MSNSEIVVAVLYGGTSAEREVSLLSGAAVYEALLASGFKATLVDTKDDVIATLRALKPHVAFNVVHGTGGEDGQLQAILEYLNIPYTGSDVASSAIGMDKLKCKRLWASKGLPVIDDRVLHSQSAWDAVSSDLGHKMVIKPSAEGSSVGVSLVSDSVSFKSALELALSCRGEVLAEQFMGGREFTVPVVDGQAYPSIQMVPANEFYDYNAKYLDGTTKYLLPSGLSESAEQWIQWAALEAFNIVGARDWGRVDFIESENGELKLLEINTVPGMTATSLLPMSLAYKGIDFVTLVENITNLALKREAH